MSILGNLLFGSGSARRIVGGAALFGLASQVGRVSDQAIGSSGGGFYKGAATLGLYAAGAGMISSGLGRGVGNVAASMFKKKNEIPFSMFNTNIRKGAVRYNRMIDYKASVIRKNYESFGRRMVGKGLGKAAGLGWGLAKPLVPGLGLGLAAGTALGMGRDSLSRGVRPQGSMASLNGMQFYDPVSGSGPRDMGMDPFADNSAGLVQALHRLS